MTKMSTKSKETEPTEEQLSFFFWLGEDGEIESVDAKEFQEKQDKWNGQRQTSRND